MKDNNENKNDEIKLKGILSEGYGIIPKKLMKANINKNIKLILAYLLSYTGKESPICFPKISTIVKDLHMGRNKVIESIKEAVDLKLLYKKRKSLNSWNRQNEYNLLFLSEDIPNNLINHNTTLSTSESTTLSTFESTTLSTFESTTLKLTTINRNINNNNNINKKSISDESLQSSYEFSNKQIKSIIKEMITFKDSPFSRSTRPKEDSDKIPTKNLAIVQRYLWQLHENTFDIDNKFNSDFLKDNKISFTGKTILNSITRCEDKWEKIKNICIMALKNYICLLDKKYWPKNKGSLAKSLNIFFYNPVTERSWFLTTLFNKPKLIKENNNEIIAISNNVFPANEYGQKDYEKSKSFLKEIGNNWDEIVYWRRLRRMYKWYEKYSNILMIYNKGNWYSNCNNFGELLDRIKEFADSWNGDWNIGNFGINNKTWNYFVSWMKKEKGVDMNPDKSELLAVIRTYENDGKKIKYADEIKKELKERR